MATRGISSSSGWHNLSTRVTTALASALLEWLLILFLFISASFSYVIRKFASYCKLQTPCLICSRLDHVLGKEEKRGYYWDLICSSHKSEISSLVLCRAHDRLENIPGNRETGLLSSATINEPNAETSPLSVDRLEESDSIFDQDPLLGENTIAKCCSCSDEKWISNGDDQKLVFTKSIRSRAADFDESYVVGNNFHEKRNAKSFVSVRDAHLRNDQVDPLSRVGYTELKITSDTESESEAPLSDDDRVSILSVNGTDDTKEDIRVPCEYMEPCTVNSDEDFASGKPETSASVLEPLLSESVMQVENTDICGSKIAPATIESGNGLLEPDRQQAERSAVFPSPSEPISFSDVPTLSNKTGVPVEVSKENYDLTTDEVGLTSEQRPTTHCEEIIKSGNKLITSEAGFEPTPVFSDIGVQNSVSFDLGDAYKLAVSSRGRQFSGTIVEHWLGKESPRISEDLKILMSQFSVNRGTDLYVNDISPRLSINGDEVKNSNVSNSAGIQILQKMISLERNESGLSIDGSIVSEIEGESQLDRFKRQVDHDRKLMNALYKELEEERNASAVAASQALAMITRLQEEKAALHMEALQYLRVMDEQSEYEMEALQKTNDLLAEKEEEIEQLEAKLAFYTKKFPDESVPENMVETNSEMNVKDIGLDLSQCTYIENDEGVPGKSVAENPNISAKADIQPVKSSSLEFQDEELYISQRLKKLEKQVYVFLNIHRSQDNSPNSENVEKESPENCEKLGNNLQTEVSVSSFKLNSDDPSSKKPPVCKQNGEPEYSGHASRVLHGDGDLASTGGSVSDFIERLQVLEADLGFLEHTINLLREGDNGIKLLQEIADQLQQLRRIGIREIDQPVA